MDWELCEVTRAKRTEPEEIDAADFARRKLGFEPDGVQERVLRRQSKRVILNCTRQWGKSTVTAAKAVHHAWTVPGSLTLVASGCERQSGEFMRKAEQWLRALEVRARGDGNNPLSIGFPNGSRIVGLPGTEATVRGFSAVSLLILDEAALVSDDLYRAMRPMLAVSGGSQWLMSTPRGKRGFFYEVWANGGPEWERVRVTAEDCPRISPKFLEEERRVLGERWFRQEYCCEFVEGVSGLFDLDLLQRAVTDRVTPLEIG